MDLGLLGKTAIVTGASRGIGRAIALALADEGASVVLCARGAERLRAVADEIADRGGIAHPIAADVTASEGARATVDAARERFGGVDILVNNVGSAEPKRLLQLTDEDWRRGFEVNFFSAVRLSLACIPGMLERCWGRIIHISSTHGREPGAYFGPYSAAKAAMINFSQNLSGAFSGQGVLTNCVIPGLTRTEMLEENTASAMKATGLTRDQIIGKMLEREPIAIRRLGEPEEIAAAVVFLASEQARWITGATLVVDGGTLRAAG